MEGYIIDLISTYKIVAKWVFCADWYIGANIIRYGIPNIHKESALLRRGGGLGYRAFFTISRPL